MKKLGYKQICLKICIFSILVTIVALMMKVSLFISLVFIILFGCTPDPDLTKITELESLLYQEINQS